ncbi:MAG TPA: hypothetical protein VG407_01645 [Caulobacteraceae bacterium]|jgi:hypothetical protein|nr:hypothetical protein [Caulobacteraceae bacterium]
MKRRLAATALLFAAVLPGACTTTIREPNPATETTCRFNADTLTFEVGDARAQARCLLRHVNKGGFLSPEQPLPPTLDRLVGTTDVPSLDALRRYVETRGDDRYQRSTWSAVAFFLDRPIARAWDNRPDAPQARYFVIHDTSEPWIGAAPFPKDLNDDPAVNDFHIYFQPGKDPVAHFFVNRKGEIALGHDFSVPWRATKREHFPDVRAKGLFLHTEMVQPRRQEPGLPRSDTIAPEPGFTDAQYDTLALLYVIASTRAHVWMTPAFHSDVDAGIAAKHDDPQHFDLNKLDAAIARALAAIG